MNVLEFIVVVTFIIILDFTSIIQSLDIQVAILKDDKTSLCKHYGGIDNTSSLLQIANPPDSSNIINGLTENIVYNIIHYANENDHKDKLLKCDSKVMHDGHVRSLLEWSLKDVLKGKKCIGGIYCKNEIKEPKFYFNKFEDIHRSLLLVYGRRTYEYGFIIFNIDVRAYRWFISLKPLVTNILQFLKWYHISMV